jgi:RibD C-terminal domain
VIFSLSPSDVGPAAFHLHQEGGMRCPEQGREAQGRGGKDIQVMGSSELVQTLIRHDLVDAYRLMTRPLVLGNGKRLVRDEPAEEAQHFLSPRTRGLARLTARPLTGRTAEVWRALRCCGLLDAAAPVRCGRR